MNLKGKVNKATLFLVAKVLIVGALGLFLLFELFQNIELYRSSLLLKSLGNYIVLLSVPFNFFLTTFPLLTSLLVFSVVSKNRQNPFGLCAILFIGSVICTPIYLYTDIFFPVSVIPLSLSFCAIIWLLLTPLLLKYLKIENKITAVVISTLLILFAQYYEWNTRKPFLRDLFSIKKDMTIFEVNKIMSSYMKKSDLPEPIIFKHSQSSTFGSDEGIVSFRDGKVESVEFFAD
jgi:hypothetical protein